VAVAHDKSIPFHAGHFPDRPLAAGVLRWPDAAQGYATPVGRAAVLDGLIAAQVDQEMDDRLRVLETVVGRVTSTIIGNTATLQTFLEDRPVLQFLFNGGIFATRIDGTAAASIPLSAERISVNYIGRYFMAAVLT
jgi:hypothetical protein